MISDDNILNDEKLNKEVDVQNESSSETKPEQPKKVIKNIAKVGISNIFTLIAGILVGFIIPKIMTNGDSTADYGYYKIFTLYLGYVGLFHFGFCDGIYLLYGGKSFEDLDKTRFRTYSKFYLIFQMLITLIITSISLCFVSTNYGFIFVFLGINLIAENVTNYYQIISQITGRFNELSLRNIIKSSLTIIAVIVLYVLFKTNIIDYLQYQIYIVIVSSISLILSFWYVITYRDITFGKSSPLNDEIRFIKKFFIVGIPLLIANLVSALLLNIDRQFVSLLFDKEIYSTYAFAYNMLNLIITATSAISIVLYPTLKRFDFEKLKINYNNFMSIIAIFVSFCLIAYFPLHLIVTHFLDKYEASLIIFRIIFPSILLTSCISMIMFNYYKSLGKSRTYFLISLIVLILSIGANLIAYFGYKTTTAISFASIIVIAIWYLITEFILIKNWKINPIKHILYMILIVTAYYLIVFLNDNVYIGFALYLASYLVITLLLYFKEIKNKFRFHL